MTGEKKKWVFGALAVLLVLAIGIGVYAKSKLDKVKQTDLNEENLNVNEEMEEENTHYLNVALFGIDAHSKDAKEVQSDAIVIASLNEDTKEIKLVSVYGNAVLVDAKGKAVAAKNIYTNGAESAVEMLNRNLDLDITHFAAVDFQAMIDVIDALGGIEIDVKEEEIQHITGYTADLITVTGKDSMGVTEAGPQILNGTQATAYCRIRATEGGDVDRAGRQKEVITKILEKMVQTTPTKLNEIIDKVFPEIETNFELKELVTYTPDFNSYKVNEMKGFPFQISEKKASEIEDAVLPSDFKGDVLKLHQMFFPDMDYSPTKNVEKAAEILKTMP